MKDAKYFTMYMDTTSDCVRQDQLCVILVGKDGSVSEDLDRSARGEHDR